MVGVRTLQLGARLWSMGLQLQNQGIHTHPHTASICTDIFQSRSLHGNMYVKDSNLAVLMR